MKKILKQIGKQKKTIIWVTVVGATLFLALPQIAFAKAGWAHILVGGLVKTLVSIIGWILAKVMGIFMAVVNYNDFTNAPVIAYGWRVVRDVANMFFIVILLVIALATILQQEKYNYKKWLPRLVLMAILINFSKTICGLLIDVAQVVMLTFVGSFSKIGAGSLTQMLGIQEWQKMKDFTGPEVSGWGVLAAYFLALLYALIALVTVLSMVVMLVMRLVMIWVYVVLSPLAYLLASFPGGENYSKKWWTEFTKNLVIGPILAFFVWLSFATLGNPSTNEDKTLSAFKIDEVNSTDGVDLEGEQQMEGYTTSETMMKFIISIAMLIGGMKIAQEVGGAAGQALGKASGKLKSAGLVAGGAVGGFALAKAKQGGKAVGRGAGHVAGSIDRTLGHTIDKQIVRAGGEAIYSDKGLFGTHAGQVKDFYQGVKDRVSLGAPKSEEEAGIKNLQRDLFEATKGDSTATTTYQGREYGLDGKVIKEVTRDASGTRTGFGAAIRDADGNEVKKMSAWGAATYDSYQSNYRGNKAKNLAEHEKKVEEAKAKYTAMDLSRGEIDRKLSSAATSTVDKMALGLIKASKAAFRTKDEVDELKQVFNRNPLSRAKLKAEIDAKQPHFNYDFDTEVGRDDFEKALRTGKIDLGKISDETFAQQGFLSVMENRFGNNFEAVMNKTLDGRPQAAHNNYRSALESRRDDEQTAGNSAQANRYASIIANSYGDWGEAFSHDPGAMESNIKLYINQARAKDLNRMDKDTYISQPVLRDMVAKNISAGQLNSMMIDGANPELVREIRDVILSLGVDPNWTASERSAFTRKVTAINANPALANY